MEMPGTKDAIQMQHPTGHSKQSISSLIMPLGNIDAEL